MFIIITIIIACSCLYGTSQISSVQESRTEKLWVPQNSRALKEDLFVKDNFETTTRAELILVKSKNNVLSPGYVSAFIDMIKSMNTISATYKEDKLTLASECKRQFTGAPCFKLSILDLWSYNETTIKSLTQPEIISRVNSPNPRSASGGPLILDSLLGGVKKSGGSIESASSSLFTFFINTDPVLTSDGSEEDARADTFEKALIDFFRAYESDEIEILTLISREFGDAFSSSISNDLGTLVFGYITLTIYVMIMLGEFDFVKTKISVALASILAVILAIGTGYGLCVYFKVIFGPVNNVLPFLLLGLGIDDSFIIVNSLSQFSSIPDIKNRFALTIAQAGTSVTVTSFSDIFAFGIGATSQLPSIAGFCIYAATSIFFVWLFQIIFFTSILAYDTKRAANNRFDILCCVTSKKSRDIPSLVDLDSLEYSEDILHHLDHHPEQQSDGANSRARKFFKEYFAPAILNDYARIAILVLTAVFLGLGIYGAVTIKSDFDFRFFIPTDSPLNEFLDLQDTDFGDPDTAYGVYTQDGNYFHSQKLLPKLSAAAAGNKFTVKGSVDSWYDTFNDWELNDSSKLTSNETYFWLQINAFFSNSSFSRYTGDIKFKGDPADGSVTKILASKISAIFGPLPLSSDQVGAMNAIRNDIDTVVDEWNSGKSSSAQLGAFPFTTLMIFWEQYAIIQRELILSISLSMFGVLFISLLLIPHPLAAILSVFSVLLSITDLFFIMSIWDVVLSSVSIVNFVLGIGIAIDTSLHIGIEFMTLKGTRKERVAATLGHIGPPVVNGIFSTIIAILFLSGAKSYIFIVFFKQWFSILLLGTFHGIVFLPVLLSFIGPSPPPSKEKTQSKDQKKSEDIPLERLG